MHVSPPVATFLTNINWDGLLVLCSLPVGVNILSPFNSIAAYVLYRVYIHLFHCVELLFVFTASVEAIEGSWLSQHFNPTKLSPYILNERILVEEVTSSMILRPTRRLRKSMPTLEAFMPLIYPFWTCSFVAQ